MGAVSELHQKVERMAVAEDGKAKSFADIVAEKKPYYNKRVELFERYIARDKAAIDAAKQANVHIKVVLPDGATKAGIKGVTTPLDVANDISKSLAKKVVVAKVDGDTWDLFRPLEGDCTLSLHSFDDPEGKEVCSSCQCSAWYSGTFDHRLGPQALAAAVTPAVCMAVVAGPAAPPAATAGKQGNMCKESPATAIVMIAMCLPADLLAFLGPRAGSGA